MTGDSGVDYPDVKAVVDVVATSRKDTLTSWVEDVSRGDLILTPAQDHTRRSVRLEPGERLQLIWKGPDELRTVPVELLEVQRVAAEPRWRVRIVGPAGRGQRRAAVRAPMTLPVDIARGKERFRGTAVDLSEGGLRCLLNEVKEPVDSESTKQPSASQRLDPGEIVDVTTGWDGDEVSARAEVIRRHPRADKQQELSLRFIGLPERSQDVIRRKVFATLRDLRVRGLM